MGRKRKPLEAFLRGRLYHTRFLHPLLKKTVSVSLGEPDEARDNLAALNEIFLNEQHWTNPPATTPESILKQWNRSGTVKLGALLASKGGRPLHAGTAEVARLTAENGALRDKIEELFATVTRLEKELEHWKGRKLNRGPLPTLAKAREMFLSTYKGRDVNATENIGYDLQRFVERFGPSTTLDKIEGKEREINAWIRGLTKDVKQGADVVKVPLSPARRAHIRLYVLKMLTETGATIDRKKIDRPGKKETRASRGPIRFLTREQAEAVAGKLAEPWASMWRVQVALGLRPDELITVCRDNFSHGLTDLRLSPLGNLTLKTGTRHIPVPPALRPLIEKRLKENPVLFPDVKTGKPWTDPKRCNRMYVRRLRNAAKACGITVEMDARIGRRTCASLLVAENVSADRIAKLMGNSAEMILEHYGHRDVTSIPMEGVTTF